MSSFKKISTLVEQKVSRMGTSLSAADNQRALREFWRHELGESAIHSVPLLLDSGRLVIFCQSPTWGTQLRHQQHSIQEKLIQAGFTVKEVKIRIRPSEILAKPSQEYRAPTPLSPKVANQLILKAQHIQHDGLRQSLLKLAGRGKKS